MVRIFLVTALSLAGMLVAPQASRAADVTRSYSYFSVGGASVQEAFEQLSRLGPQVESTGQRHAGATRMTFRDRTRYDRFNGSCRVKSATVTVEARITLPRWTKRKSGSPDSLLIWDALAADIKRHEEDHVSIARRHAAEMERRLLAIPPQKDCQSAERKRLDILARQLQRHDAEQARFDRTENRNFSSRLDRLIRLRLSGG